MAPTDVFHEGEKAVQERAGVRGPASKLGPRMVQSELPTDFADFLASVPFIYVAAPAPGQFQTLALFMYQQGWTNFHLGQAATTAWTMLFIILFLVGVNAALARGRTGRI